MSGAPLVAFGHTPAIVIAGVVLRILYARNLEFVHETLHGIALRSSRGNRLAGTPLAIPTLVSFERWRYEHARHHRDVRKEGFRYEYERLNTIAELFVHLLMLRHFGVAVANVARALWRGTEYDAP